MYAIQDRETKTYLSDFSFQLVDEGKNQWLYTTYKGKIGTKFYNTKENAQKVFEMLQEYNEQSGLHRKLQIVQIDTEQLPIGDRVYIYS
ncbi:hypothetical protein [Clostridium thermosuccinogenes]|uniref:hypothetical protein n=1 Tax=Clostridium thermosuccinogenes TaxID=84032 RepID=UPI000CCC7A08|nr:hypothetical protein [Pseudoclostridium thermosuccinogenes]PNT94168.1 hypothetical protein CDQ83_12015 [Pseudoclostridium thermosuccinogenes]